MKDLKWKVLEHIHGGDFGREGDFGRDVNERSLAVYAAQEKLREMNNEELLDAISEVFEKDPGRGEGMMTDPDDDLVMLKVAQLSRLREENEKLQRERVMAASAGFQEALELAAIIVEAAEAWYTNEQIAAAIRALAPNKEN